MADFRKTLSPKPEDVALPVPDLDELEQGSSLWKDAWIRLRKNHLAVFSLAAFVLICLFCFAGPLLTPFDTTAQDPELGATPPFARMLEVSETLTDPETGAVVGEDLYRKRFRDGVEDIMASLASGAVIGREGSEVLPALETSPAGPGRPAREQWDQLARYFDGGGILTTLQTDRNRGRILTSERTYQPSSRIHLFGTDTLGRDLLTRVMAGGRISLAVGFVATLVSLVIGVIYGAVSAYAGGMTDAVMMRIVDILYALPFTIFVILLMVLFDRSILLIFIAIGAVEWLTMARIVRGQVASLKEQEFVEAAVSLGYSTPRIILRHLIPNVLGSIAVYATLTVPAVMLLESFISFLGLGISPPDTSWGVLIKEGADAITIFPWLLIFPAFFFSMALFSLNFLGDGLRDALDPRSSKD